MAAAARAPPSSLPARRPRMTSSASPRSERGVTFVVGAGPKSKRIHTDFRSWAELGPWEGVWGGGSSAERTRAPAASDPEPGATSEPSGRLLFAAGTGGPRVRGRGQDTATPPPATGLSRSGSFHHRGARPHRFESAAVAAPPHARAAPGREAGPQLNRNRTPPRPIRGAVRRGPPVTPRSGSANATNASPAFVRSLPAPPAAMTTYWRPFDLIGRRGRVAAGREGVLPEELAGLLVEGVDALVLRAGDEHQAAGRHDRAAEGLGARPRDAAGGQLGVLAERDPPGEFARVEVDRVQARPTAA